MKSLLVLPSTKSEYALINSAVRSLRRADRLLTSRIELATKLATMLVATSRQGEAQELLDSVIEFANYDGNESRWGAFGCSIVLRSYIARRSGNVALSSRLMALIASNEMYAVENGREQLAADCLDEHEPELAQSAVESPANAIDILAGRICEYAYFVESHDSIYQDLPPDIVDLFHSAYQQCISEVRNRLA